MHRYLFNVQSKQLVHYMYNIKSCDTNFENKVTNVEAMENNVYTMYMIGSLKEQENQPYTITKYTYKVISHI